ncbi:MAG: HlyC/CorC family transporter [Clostridia bacterium]|nr:HlyC/CorC family transporter [Clostridia bacterium]
MLPPSCLLGAVQFNLADGLCILGIFILLLFSAFFSASETAFLSVNPVRIKTLAEEKQKGARRALYITDHFEKTLSTILVGNNIANIASTTICAYLFAKFIISPTLANILNTVIMTVVVLIFGEILPKSIAKNNPEKVALSFSGCMYFLIKILFPITIIFTGIQKLTLKNIKTEDTPTVTEDELEDIIDTMQEEGVIASEDADLIQGVLDIAEKTVYDIMVPRVDIEAIEITANNEEVIKKFNKTQFSRLPVFEEDKDNIVGVLNQKDFIIPFVAGKKVSVKSAMMPPLFVSESMKVNDLIREMQKEKKHLAIVLDEHGGTSGIVCMEDALEEMVGEIYDEHDDVENTPLIEKVADGEYIISPDAELAILYDELGITTLPETEYSTVGGFVFEKLADIPKENDTIEIVENYEILNENSQYENKSTTLRFTITKVEDRRIKELNLKVESTNIE